MCSCKACKLIIKQFSFTRKEFETFTLVSKVNDVCHFVDERALRKETVMQSDMCETKLENTDKFYF